MTFRTCVNKGKNKTISLQIDNCIDKKFTKNKERLDFTQITKLPWLLALWGKPIKSLEEYPQVLQLSPFSRYHNKKLSVMTPTDARARRELDQYAISTPRVDSRPKAMQGEIGRKSQYYENKQMGRVKFNVLKQSKTDKQIVDEKLIGSPGIEKSKSIVEKSSGFATPK